jgi:hypothetical protein
MCSLKGCIHTIRQLFACNGSKKKESASNSRASLNKENKEENIPSA